IIVYVGAVTVLFLFIIMIIPLKEVSTENTLFKSVRKVVPMFFFVILLAVLINVSGNFVDGIYELIPFEFNVNTIVLLNDLEIVGKMIYYDYSLALIVSAILLFIALILAILLCYEI